MNISPYLVFYKVTEYDETGPTNTLFIIKGMKCEDCFELKKFNFFHLMDDDGPERYYVAVAKIKQQNSGYLEMLIYKKVLEVGEYSFKLLKNMKRPLLWDLQALNCDVKNFDYIDYIDYVDERIKRIYELFKNLLSLDTIGLIVDKLFW